MKKTILALALTASAATLSAAQLLEAIVIRVGDRVVTRTQYAKRLKDGFTEIEQTSTTPAEAAAKKEELRKNLANDLIAELLIKDRADRLSLNVNAEELKEAMSRLKDQYGIKTDAEFDDSLRKSGMTRADMEGRLRDTILMNKVFARELKQREELLDKELRERYDREKESFRLPERARLREIIVIKPDDPTKIEAARQRANDLAAQARTGDFAKLATTSSDRSRQGRLQRHRWNGSRSNRDEVGLAHPESRGANAVRSAGLRVGQRTHSQGRQRRRVAARLQGVHRAAAERRVHPDQRAERPHDVIYARYRVAHVFVPSGSRGSPECVEFDSLACPPI